MGRMRGCLWVLAILLLSSLTDVAFAQGGGNAVETGSVKGVLVGGDKGAALTGASVYLHEYFAKTDNGKPCNMVMFGKDARPVRTSATGGSALSRSRL